MKKFLCGILLILTLILTLSPAALAADIPLVTDVAGLLSTEEVLTLNGRAEEIAGTYPCEVAVVTLADMGGADAYEYAKEVYRAYNFGYGAQKSGLLLLLSMAERDYALIAYGEGNRFFTDHGKDVLLDEHVLPLLGEDRYYEAFSAYLETAAEYLQMAADDRPFDTDTDPDYGRAGLPVKLAITIFVPLLIAGIVCLIWRGQMKTAVLARTADNYIPQNGFHLTRREDRFLYRTETRRIIEKKSSSGGGGGGTSTDRSGFSGRSGKF